MRLRGEALTGFVTATLSVTFLPKGSGRTMTETIATQIWLAIGAYCSVGGVVTLGVLLGAMQRLDPLASTAPLGVKLLIAPGLIALWPLALVRLAQGPRP